MVFGGDEDENHGDEGGDDEAEVDLDVGEEHEPPIPGSFFELTSAL